MPNRLAEATSLYLRQHADNPVDWREWGPEAFAAASEREVPVFLSVGYSSCHWCHVMAHESFEDEATAAVLNERFVPVKVDREERPDVDAVYMQAVQALTGHGGWPMSVFLTPDGAPFYCGTYWPSEPRHGMPSFRQVLAAVDEAWRERRDEVTGSAARIAEALASHRDATPADALDLTVSDAAARLLVDRAWDRELGGFGRAPKFPQAMTIEFLLWRAARTGEPDVLEAATSSLDAMARGGIHDQLAGGFHRYSTDARWLVPHFEKMLYDNALLLATYATAAALTGRADLDRVARATADYLLTELRLPDGGFASATDADTEGEEGRTFVWSAEELAEVVRAVDADPDRYLAFFGASATGNWEGTNVLHEPVPRLRFAADRDLEVAVFESELSRVRSALLERRGGRTQPARDEKVLTSWNALAIRGLVRAGTLLGEPRYIRAATETAAFLESALVVDGRLHHAWMDGAVGASAFLEDVALLAGALLDLYAATGEVRWYRWAVALADDAVDRFHDPDGSGYFQTAADAEALYTRPKETWDNATPSGNSVLAEVFARVAAYTGEATWSDRAAEVLRLFQDGMRANAPGYGYALGVVEFLRAGPREVAIVGDAGPERERLVRRFWAVPRPGTVVAVASPDDEAAATIPLLVGRGEVDGRPAAFVCRGFVCDAPVTDPDELQAALEDDRA